MLSKTRSTPDNSPAPEVTPDTITGPVTNGSQATNGSVLTQPAKPAQAAAHDANGPGPGAKTGERLHQATSQPTGPSGRTRLALGKTVPLRLIGVIFVGLIVGAILGAVSAPGWVIGLLVATVTVMLSAVLQRFSRIR
jgi:hypothetical protein